ncbi:MAG: hypothetical protein WAZ34_07930 [Rhodocyclaceae bacterium]
MSSQQRKAAILDYWRANELFSAQPVPAVQNRKKAGETCGPVFLASAETPLPWSATNPPSLFNWAEQRFHIYCGIDQQNEIPSRLAVSLGGDFPPSALRGKGKNIERCLFSFSVDTAGFALVDTFHLSALAWLAGRSHPAEPFHRDWLSGFEKTAAALAHDFTRRLSTDDGVSRPLDYTDLLDETRSIASELGLPTLAENIVIRIEQCAGKCPDSRRIAAESASTSSELKKIAQEIRNHEAGRGLCDYLANGREVMSTARIDVLATPLPLFQHLIPPLFPPARWPSADNSALHCGPQFVVNAVLKTLRRGAGLFSVEGPAGNKRTAVLRDIVASVVVDRARRLAQLLRPEQAFIGERCWTTSSGIRKVSTWRKDLRGFELLIAGNDTASVRGIAAALSDTATGGVLPLSSWQAHTEPTEQPAWAPLAAHIEDKNDEWHFHAAAKDQSALSAASLSAALSLLDETPQDWNEAVENFRHAENEELRLHEIRSREFENFVALGNMCQEIDAREARLKRLTLRESEIRNEFDAARVARDIAANDVALADAQRLAHYAQRPQLSAIVLSLGTVLQQWHDGNLMHALFLEHAEQRLSKAESRIEHARQTLGAIEREREQEIAAFAEQHRTASMLKAAQTGTKIAIGDFYPSQTHWNDATLAINRPAPWSDPLWNAARANVFTAALRLHHAFIAANAARLSVNFDVVLETLAGKTADNAPAEALEAAWSMLVFRHPGHLRRVVGNRPDIFQPIARITRLAANRRSRADSRTSRRERHLARPTNRTARRQQRVAPYGRTFQHHPVSIAHALSVGG